MQFKDETFIEIAKLMAKNSYAERLKVGAVLAKEDRIMATGYNGTPKGYNNECEYIDTITGDKKTKDIVVHAEQNLLMFCAKHGIKTEGCTLYITHSPCITCAKLIASAGIKEVVYENDYRDREGLDLLNELDIKTRKHSTNY